MSLFVDNFWGVQDITGGFQVVCNYMKKGRKECEDAIDFFKERVAIEEEYSKKLAKLAKTTDNKGGFGVELAEDELNTTLRAAWKRIRESTEVLANKHKNFAEEIHSQVHQPMLNMKESQKKMVADVTDKVEQAQKEFIQMRSTLPKLKKTYEAKCKEHDSAEEELNAAHSQMPKNDKNIAKFQQKIAKLKKEAEQTDQAYKQGVDKLEETRVKWEEEMTNCCALFEGIEVNRLGKMKDFFSSLTSIEDKLNAALSSEVIEPMKVYVECIKSEVDIELFVSEKRTGYSRPGPTFYENYYTGLLKDAVFGVDLDAHLSNTDRKVPEILELCVAHIEKNGIADEGIYRLSGRQAKVQQLKSLYDKNKANFNLADPDIHTNDIASLTKLYLRELPKPLCTYEFYNAFIDAAKYETPEERSQRMKAVVQKLPEANQQTLLFLLRHLRKVSTHSETNKMGVHNLAIVFAPGLLRSADESTALRDFRYQSKVLEDFINNYETIFGAE